MTTTSTEPHAGASSGQPDQSGLDLAALRGLVGRSSPFNSARDPVNETMIRHWCDIIGEQNPVYTDAAAAAASAFGGIVAPPAMLDVWDKPGLHMTRDPDNPQSQALTILDGHGFTSTVAVNSELELARPLRPGEMVHSTLTLEDVSEEKQTGLGVGHFVTSRHRVSRRRRARRLRALPDAEVPARHRPHRRAGGRPVGSARPRSRQAAAARDQPRQPVLLGRCTQPRAADPDLQPAARRSTSRRRRGAATAAASTWGSRSPPGAGRSTRGRCRTTRRSTASATPCSSGWSSSRRAPGSSSNIVGCTRDQLHVGMPLELFWLDSHPALVEGADDSRGPITLPQFRPARPARRATTPVASAMSRSATRCRSGRDPDDADADRRRRARDPRLPGRATTTATWRIQRGSKDIFMNINTSLGLIQRYVTDWAGPEAVWRALRVRLGAPNYPYDTDDVQRPGRRRRRGDRCRHGRIPGHATSSATTSPAPSSWSSPEAARTRRRCPMTAHGFAGRTAIVGIGATEFSKDSGRSELQLALEACSAALRGRRRRAAPGERAVDVHDGDESRERHHARPRASRSSRTSAGSTSAAGRRARTVAVRRDGGQRGRRRLRAVLPRVQRAVGPALRRRGAGPVGRRDRRGGAVRLDVAVRAADAGVVGGDVRDPDHARVRRHQRGLRPRSRSPTASTRRPTRRRTSTASRSPSRTIRRAAGSSSRCTCSTAARRPTAARRSWSPPWSGLATCDQPPVVIEAAAQGMADDQQMMRSFFRDVAGRAAGDGHLRAPDLGDVGPRPGRHPDRRDLRPLHAVRAAAARGVRLLRPG